MQNPFAWLPFGLLPSAREAGRPDPEIVEMRLPAGETDWATAMTTETIETVQVWPVDAVLKNFALQAAVHHTMAGEFASGKRKARSTRDELLQWITNTRSVAHRLPFRGPQESMLEAAERLEQLLGWQAQFFETWPPAFETKADADWRTSLNLWAADRLLRAVNETEPEYARFRAATSDEPTEYLRVPPTKFWTAMFDWYPSDRPPLPFVLYKNAQQRVTNFDRTIKPGMRDALMVIQLRDVLTNGRFGPDEQLRARLDVH